MKKLILLTLIGLSNLIFATEYTQCQKSYPMSDYTLTTVNGHSMNFRSLYNCKNAEIKVNAQLETLPFVIVWGCSTGYSHLGNDILLLDSHHIGTNLYAYQVSKNNKITRTIYPFSEIPGLSTADSCTETANQKYHLQKFSDDDFVKL
ncbi:MAG: hypothetical protein HOO06_10795 [Bdellovibrionaceae bacterium]|nr:hypothetical protein [Pseudobdellovibrionaceae bacterium]